MKVSTKGRYALRLMTELARADRDVCLSIKEISERQGISEKYLEQIVRPLKQAGLVTSIRGAQGGYRLCDEPENITVGQVLRVTEGDLAPVSCVSDDDEKACSMADSCETIFIWRSMKEAIDKVADSITMADLAVRKANCTAATVERIQALSSK